jgi:hypothetical protein
MAEDAAESAGAKAPAIIISAQQIIARERALISKYGGGQKEGAREK